MGTYSGKSIYSLIVENLISFLLGLLLAIISIVPNAWLNEVQRFGILVVFGFGIAIFLGYRVAKAYLDQLTVARRDVTLSRIVPRTFYLTQNKKICVIKSDGSAVITRKITAMNISSGIMPHFDYSLSYSLYPRISTLPQIRELKVNEKPLLDPARYFIKLEKVKAERGQIEQIGRLEIPLTPPLDSMKSVDIEWTMEIPNVYKNMKEKGEWSGFHIVYPSADLEIEAESPEGFQFSLVPASELINNCDEPKSVLVKEIRTKKINKEETANSPEPSIIDDRRRLTLRIKEPLLGHSYEIFFRCKEPTITSTH